MRIASWVAGFAFVAAAGCGARSDSPPSMQEKAKAHYLANEGVLIASREARIAFDPLFRNNFGQYQTLPEELERALFAGEPPFTDLDAVFISHYHEDHFSPADALRLLQERRQVRLYAPAQAVSQMRALEGANDEVLSRVTEIRLAYKDPPMVIEAGDLRIEAVRVPHAGWPGRNADVENIAYRVTLDESTTVVHLGDADARDEHYAHDASYWSQRSIDLALPPYWYLQSEEGRKILEERLKPGHMVGIHVPAKMKDPSMRPLDLKDYDLFVIPGETREIP
jgi:L-ascorbate metabolism protein UlaG (beta-lactamase superfamily)